MSELQTTEATPDAVNFVFDNLWDRGERELAIIGVSNEMARGHLLQQRHLGRPTLAIWAGGEPVLIAGLQRIDHPRDAAMTTWFMATEMFTHHARAITRELREKLAIAALTYKLEFIEITSPCVHPKTWRWFRALGFDLDVDRYITTREGSEDRLYRFERRFDQGGRHVLPKA